MGFKEKLSFLRKQHGMTQMELAEKLDISRQAVSRWEQGVSEPSTENLVNIGKLFGVSVDVLINENVQLRAESSVQLAETEEDVPTETYSKYGYSLSKIIKITIFGITILAIAVVLVVCIGAKRSKKTPVPMEEINKDIITESETVVFPLG